MKLFSLKAREILDNGGRLRKTYWRKDTHMILWGVWFYRTVGPFGHMSREILTLNKIEYDLYPLSYDSIYKDEWEVASSDRSNSGFGLDSF